MLNKIYAQDSMYPERRSKDDQMTQPSGNLVPSGPKQHLTFPVDSSVSLVVTIAADETLLNPKPVVETEVATTPAPPVAQPVDEASDDARDTQHGEEWAVDEAEADVPENLLEGRDGILGSDGRRAACCNLLECFNNGSAGNGDGATVRGHVPVSASLWVIC